MERPIAQHQQIILGMSKINLNRRLARNTMCVRFYCSKRVYLIYIFRFDLHVCIDNVFDISTRENLDDYDIFTVCIECAYFI